MVKADCGRPIAGSREHSQVHAHSQHLALLTPDSPAIARSPLALFASAFNLPNLCSRLIAFSNIEAKSEDPRTAVAESFGLSVAQNSQSLGVQLFAFSDVRAMSLSPRHDSGRITCVAANRREVRYLSHLLGTRLAILAQAQPRRHRSHKPCCRL